MLLCVLICMSPDVVGLDGSAGGDGVGSIAGVAHCECWLVMLWVWVTVVSRGPSITSGHWSLTGCGVVLSTRATSSCVSQNPLAVIVKEDLLTRPDIVCCEGEGPVVSSLIT